MTDQFFNSVSRQHFEIWTQERANYTAVVLTNYSGNGTVVNNVIIQKGYIFSIRLVESFEFIFILFLSRLRHIAMRFASYFVK